MINTEIELARQCVENTGSNLFLTGKAGTGKTTFLKNLRESSPKRMMVVAPTGIAAINAGGVTMHSFFQLSFGPYIPDTTYVSAQKAYRFSKEKINIIRSLDLLVIDEISMVRADLLDSVDAVLRRYRNRLKPFGGVQLLMIGDLQQLAPVVKEEEWALLSKYYNTPYFFGSRALQETDYLTIQLETVYRQTDSLFLSLLNRIRDNKIDSSLLDELNKRYIPGFRPDEEEGYIRLTTHNYQAQRINEQQLKLLPGKAFSFHSRVEGNFPESSYPADSELVLKPGAQIMFIKNDVTGDKSGKKRFFNGKIGVVVSISGEKILVRGKEDMESFFLERAEWSNVKYTLNEATGEIKEETEGSFFQFPVRLAWAITVHKSQGLTFERAIIDVNASFAHGQVYVALSRCKTLEGMVLDSPLTAASVICDETVREFTREIEHARPDKERVRKLQSEYYYKLLCEQFDYSFIDKQYSYLIRLLDEHLYKLYPMLVGTYHEGYDFLKKEIGEVADKFRVQYTAIWNETANLDDTSKLNERLKAGAAYFHEKSVWLWDNVIKKSIPDIDNKEAKKRLKETYQTLYEQLQLKVGTLAVTANEGFTTSAYLKEKARISIAQSKKENPKVERASKREKVKKGSAKVKEEPTKVEVPMDILHPALYNQLIRWRNSEAVRSHLPVYMLLQQKALLGVVNLLPDTEEALLTIPYLGKKTVDKYGDELLEMVRLYKKSKR